MRQQARQDEASPAIQVKWGTQQHPQPRDRYTIPLLARTQAARIRGGEWHHVADAVTYVPRSGTAHRSCAVGRYEVTVPAANGGGFTLRREDLSEADQQNPRAAYKMKAEVKRRLAALLTALEWAPPAAAAAMVLPPVMVLADIIPAPADVELRAISGPVQRPLRPVNGGLTQLAVQIAELSLANGRMRDRCEVLSRIVDELRSRVLALERASEEKGI